MLLKPAILVIGQEVREELREYRRLDELHFPSLRNLRMIGQAARAIRARCGATDALEITGPAADDAEVLDGHDPVVCQGKAPNSNRISREATILAVHPRHPAGWKWWGSPRVAVSVIIRGCGLKIERELRFESRAVYEHALPS